MKKIAIVVGHQQSMPGAVALPPISQTEYAYNTNLSKVICAVLNNQYICTVYFRDALGLTGTYKQIALAKPDYCIELHFNSANKPEAYGTEVLVVERNRHFGQCIQDALCKALGRTGAGNRGLLIPEVNANGHFSVDTLPCPSALIEPFFGSNTKDCQLAFKNETLIAGAILVALKAYEA